jgi:glycosyltransferase involved in cell wall biosynthesis
MISIVIPTRNSESTLPACLESIKKQDFDDYEVIVVDSSSTDRTSEIAKSHGARVICFNGLPPRARNHGFSKSKGDVFLSLDSDMIMQPGLLREISEKIRKNDSLIIPEPGSGKGFLSECKTLEKDIYLGDTDVEAVRAFTKKLFTDAGGYSKDVHFGEDWDLHQRITKSKNPGRTEAGVFHDSSTLTFSGLIKKSYKYGKSLPSYMKSNGSKKFVRTRKNFIFGCISKLPSRPATAMGLIAIKATEYLAGSLGYVESRLKRR